jgi:predicted nucleic acid-binding protein
VLLKAKQVGLIDRILPILDHLRSLNFRMDAAARADVLALAGE